MVTLPSPHECPNAIYNAMLWLLIVLPFIHIRRWSQRFQAHNLPLLVIAKPHSIAGIQVGVRTEIYYHQSKQTNWIGLRFPIFHYAAAWFTIMQYGLAHSDAATNEFCVCACPFVCVYGHHGCLAPALLYDKSTTIQKGSRTYLSVKPYGRVRDSNVERYECRFMRHCVGGGRSPASSAYKHSYAMNIQFHGYSDVGFCLLLLQRA